MMQSISIRAAVLATLTTGSAALAGFTVTTQLGAYVTVNGTPMVRWDVTAVNTGGDTGTQVKGLEWNYTGARAYFQVTDETDPAGNDPDHIPDTVNLLSNQLTRVRVNTSPTGNTFVGVSPATGPIAFNPYMCGVKHFSGAVANTGNTQATGAGFQIMRIFLLPGQYGFLGGNIGGDAGAKVPFSGVYPGGIPGGPAGSNPTIDSISAEPAVAYFGSDFSAGAPFSVTVHASDTNPTNVLSLTAANIAGVYDVSIAGGGAGPQDFVITGKIAASRIYTPMIIPITLQNQSGGAVVDSICVYALPEPATFAALALCATVLGRRRD